MHTENKKTHVTLTFHLWPWNSIGLQRLWRYICVQNFIKLSAAVHELSTVHQISDNSRLRSRMSLERIKQSTSGKRRYQLRFFPRSRKTILANLGPLMKTWPWLSTYGLDIPWGSKVCRGTCSCKLHQTESSGSWVIVVTGEKLQPILSSLPRTVTILGL